MAVSERAITIDRSLTKGLQPAPTTQTYSAIAKVTLMRQAPEQPDVGCSGAFKQ
jgi:hypothetical protein